MKYELLKTDYGYKILKQGHSLPLPYLYASKQYAKQCCDEFNKYGAIAECCCYYKKHVAGHRVLKDYKYAYEKWLVENYEKFK